MKTRGWLGATAKRVVLTTFCIAVTSLLAPAAIAWNGWGDESEIINVVPSSTCTNAAKGYYSVFLGYFAASKCTLVGVFAVVYCDGNGGGSLVDTVTVILPQNCEDEG